MECPELKAVAIAGTAFLAIVAGTFSVRGDITLVEESFAGDLIETWEEFPVGNPGSPATIFGGGATISGGHPFVWKTTSRFGVPGGLGLGPFTAKAHDGTHGYATSVSPGSARIDFETPVTDFGGYWGYAVGYPAATFAFYDSQGGLIGGDSLTYTSPNNDGTLQWQGWHSSKAIASIEYSGHWVANDSLRIISVPEPSTVYLLLVAGLAIASAGISTRHREEMPIAR